MTSHPIAARVARCVPVVGAPALAALAIVVLDRVIAAINPGVAELAPLDWSAHLLTAALVLVAVVGPRRCAGARLWFAAAMVGAVLIDADHIPLYAGVESISVGGRPFTHSLSTAAVLAVITVAVPRTAPRTRIVVLGLATGVIAHLIRDAATGPGVPLWWPWSDSVVLLPHSWYAAAVGCLAVIATVRIWAATRRRAGVTPSAPLDFPAR